MTPLEIIELVKRHDVESVLSAVAEGPYPHVVLKAERLVAVAGFLKTEPRLRFDLLRCISAIDWPARNSIELAYDLISTLLAHAFAVKVVLDRANPQAESVGGIWPAAQWHEREAFDLIGIVFDEHPDLRRILLPDDWEGYPLRKDYKVSEFYNGMNVPY